MDKVPFNHFGIDPLRLLGDDAGKVRARFMRASMRPAHCPEPSLLEVRWSDDYRYVFIHKASGLMACGFDGLLFTDHKPVAEDKNWAIFSDTTPAARSLLGAIQAVREGSPFATREWEGGNVRPDVP